MLGGSRTRFARHSASPATLSTLQSVCLAVYSAQSTPSASCFARVRPRCDRSPTTGGKAYVPTRVHEDRWWSLTTPIELHKRILLLSPYSSRSSGVVSLVRALIASLPGRGY